MPCIAWHVFPKLLAVGHAISRERDGAPMGCAHVCACLLTWRSGRQVAERVAGGAQPTFRSVAAQLVREEGLRGFARGLLPRIANTAL